MVINSKINDDGAHSTVIHVKTIDNSIYFNYNSFFPKVYKNSVVKTFLYSAFKLCSNWESFDVNVKGLEKTLSVLITNYL